MVSYAFPMIPLWFSYDLLWFSNGVPMFFPMVSYDLSGHVAASAARGFLILVGFSFILICFAGRHVLFITIG